jgi:citrate lyase subunit beta/citryl-CoA lyase
MSRRSRDLPRRSCLVVPGSSARFLAKAATLPADEVVLDLEDAVAELAKVEARRAVAAAVRSLDWDERVVCVRLNGWASPYTLRDLLEVVGAAGPRLDEVMLPKAASAGEVVALDLLLSQLEQEAGLPAGHLGIEVQIESADGLAAVGEICAASPRLEAVVLGPVDLAASLGMPLFTVGGDLPGYPGDHLHHVLFELLVAGRRSGLQVIDGPYLSLGDEDGLRTISRRRAALGLDGKWAVHPSQIAVLNEVFTPPSEELEWARAVLAALEEAAVAERRGALRHGGEMIDEASRKLARRLVARSASPGSRTGPAAGGAGGAEPGAK